MKKIYLMLCCMMALTAFGQPAQVSFYPGNGRSSFGGALGNGSLKVTELSGTLSFEFTKGTGNVGNAIVIYIDSKTGGINSTSGLTDVGDNNRKGISGYDGTSRATLNFPSGFVPDYAISLVPGNGSNFGGLWSLTGINPSNLDYVTSVNLSPSNDQTAAVYTFDCTTAQLGLPAGSHTFTFLATLVSTTGYRSDEFIGTPGPGTAGDI
ncbi:MAG: hypothetical protein ABI208_04320, partial [Ginsengibacter sp.]